MSKCCYFNQKTAYEMRISDWSSDVCSSDLLVWAIMHSLAASQPREWEHQFEQTLKSEIYEQFNMLLCNPSRSSVEQKQLLHNILFVDHKNRTEARRVGKECVRTCRSRGSTYH